MTRDRVRVRSFVRRLAAVVSAGALGMTGNAAAEGTLPPEGTPAPGCKELGEVVGTHFDASPQMAAAKESALKDARDMGATLVKVVPEKTYQSQAYEVTYTAIAYRCPGDAASGK